MMNMTSTAQDKEWFKGRPPCVGWWNASRDRNPAIWRWWDGAAWSYPTPGDHRAKPEVAKTKDPQIQSIFWNDYWPHNALVPRVNPNGEDEDRLWMGFINARIVQIHPHGWCTTDWSGHHRVLKRKEMIQARSAGMTSVPAPALVSESLSDILKKEISELRNRLALTEAHVAYMMRFHS